MTDSIPSGSSVPPLTHRMSMPQGSWHSYVSPPPPPTSALPSTISVSGPESSSHSVGATSYPMAESLGGSPLHHPVNSMGQGQELGYSLSHAPSQYSNTDSYRNLAYPSRALAQPHHQSQQQQQHIPVATMGYEQNIPSLQATHLPMRSHHQQQQQQAAHQYPSHLVHTPPAHSQIGYHWDSRG